MDIYSDIASMPPPRKGGRPAAYPWHDMQVGEYFEVEEADPRHKHIRQLAWHAGKVRGMTFTTRKVGKMLRVWRTE